MEKLANRVPKAVRDEGFVFLEIKILGPLLNGILIATFAILFILDVLEIRSTERVNNIGHNATKLHSGGQRGVRLIGRKLSRRHRVLDHVHLELLAGGKEDLFGGQFDLCDESAFFGRGECPAVRNDVLEG